MGRKLDRLIEFWLLQLFYRCLEGFDSAVHPDGVANNGDDRQRPSGQGHDNEQDFHARTIAARPPSVVHRFSTLLRDHHCIGSEKENFDV